MMKMILKQMNLPETDEPDKFKGKSREDIIKSYQNLEALAGSHAQTISELKKTKG